MSEAVDHEAPRLSPTGDEFLSPSRVDKLDTCVRAFGLRYIDHIKAPDKPSAAFGTLVHLKQQFYMITSILPEAEIVQIGAKKIDAGAVAIAGVQYLPLPHPSIKTEAVFEYEAFPGIFFTGKIDVYDPERIRYQHVNADGSIVNVAFEIGDWSDEPINGTELTYRDTTATWAAYDSKGRPIPLVIDHKTTGDFKWQKSADALRATLDFKGDPQPGFYGDYAVREFIKKYGEPPEYVHFRWVYYLRSEKEHKARCTDLRLTPAEIREICERWKETAEKTIELQRAKISGHDLPANLESCQKYGGCEYGPPTRSSPDNLNICRRTSGERMRAAMTTTTLPMAEQVRLALAGAGANPFANATAPAATPSAATGANPFASVQAPEANRAAPPPAGGNPFAAATSPASAPATNGNPFAAASAPAPAASPAAGNPFASGALAAMTTIQHTPAPAVDPRLAECHPAIDPAQRPAYLDHCDKHGLDHRTGQPKGASPAVISPVAASAPATIPNEAEAFRALAQRMYAEKRRPDASTHPEVTRLFSALETINGPIAVGASTPAEAPKKRGRPKKTNPATGVEEEDDSPQIVVTQKAIQEMIAFLQSLIA